MRAVPSERLKVDKSIKTGKPNKQMKPCVDPAFSQESDNDTFDALARAGKDVQLFLKATMSLGTTFRGENKSKAKSIFTSLKVDRKADTIEMDGNYIRNFKELILSTFH